MAIKRGHTANLLGAIHATTAEQLFFKSILNLEDSTSPLVNVSVPLMRSPQNNPWASESSSLSPQPAHEERPQEPSEGEMSSQLSHESPQTDSLTPNDSDTGRPDEEESTPRANQHRIQRGSMSDVPEANQEATGGAELQQNNAFERSCSKPVYYRGDLIVYINGSDDERPQANLSQETSSELNSSEAPKRGLVLGLLEMLPEDERRNYIYTMLVLGMIVVWCVTGFVILMAFRFPVGAPKPSAN